MKQPTARQLEVLQVFADYQAEHGYPPTVRELCGMLGLASCVSVNNPDGNGHLQCLRRKGCLERAQAASRTARSWRITDLGYYFLGLPAHRAITTKPSKRPATGAVDLGTRCRGRVVVGDDVRECGVQLFGGLHLCANHRRVAAA